MASTYDTLHISVNLLVIVVDELAGARVDGRHKEEDDVEQNNGLDLPNGDASLKVELSKSSLARYNLANNGRDETELSHAADEQLISLGEAEDRACDEGMKRERGI